MNFLYHIHAACYITYPYHAPCFHYSSQFVNTINYEVTRYATVCVFVLLPPSYV